MNRLLTIAQRELISMFRVPAGWIIIALFTFLTAVLFVNMTVLPGQPGSLRYFFSSASWLLIPIAPAISMRLISEEYRSGSFESLRTTPAGEWSVAIGKYLASVAFLVLMLVPTIVYPITLFLISDPAPDLGPIASGYLMLVLVGALYLGVGLVASALTPSQTLAFLGTLMTLILWMVLTSLVAPKAGITLGGALNNLSISGKINELSKGVLDTSTLSFFVLGIVWMIVLTTGVLEIRRLGRHKALVALFASVFVLASAASVFFAGILTNQHHTRIDVTAIGAHQLSPRADSMVERLTGPTEIVLALDMSRSDRRTVDLVIDVLEAYDRSSPLITSRTIDLSAADAQNRQEDLIEELRDREQSTIDANMIILSDASAYLETIQTTMSSIAPDLESVGNLLDTSTSMGASNKGFFDQRASLMRVAARELGSQRSILDDQIRTPTGIGGLPPFEQLDSALSLSIGRTIDQLDDLGAQLTAFADAETINRAARDQTRPIIRKIEQARDDASIAHAQIRGLQRTDMQSVGRALQTGEALLVIGPADQGIAAVDLKPLLIPASGIELAGGSAAGIIGPRAQELVATAIGQLVIPAQPILVLVHGYGQDELLGSSGFFQRTVQQLAQREIDTIEWAAVENPNHPNLSMINPDGQRPVVYMIIAVDSAAGSGDSGLNGAKRATAMASVVRSLVDQGRPVLMSLNPSVFPTFGDPDPMSAIAAEFGIVPDSGRTLLHDRVGPLGRVAYPVSELVHRRDPGTDHVHPIDDAMHGLNAVFPWAVPMQIEESEISHAWAIVTMPGNESTWAESRWIQLKSAPANGRELMRDQPVFDAQSDARSDQWIIAAAGERRFSGRDQRMIVVGSNNWANDAIAFDAEQIVEGRITRKYPGNALLLESSIAWLAGHDDLIAPGTEARSIATIIPMEDSKLSALRWILLGGIPGLVLVMGMASRLMFG